MSNSKNAISEIKKLMVQFGFLAEEPVYQSFKVEDDTIIEAEKLAIGNKVFKINELFERVVLEDGAYTIPNSYNFEVADGTISLVEEIFTNAKLKDGTEIKVRGAGLENGSKVFINSDGTELPIPDGSHELEDGTKIETKDGEIISIINVSDEEKGPGEETESPAEEGSEEPSPIDEATNKEQSKSKDQHFDEMYDMMKEFVTKCSQKMNDIEGSYSALKAEFEAFKKEPAAKPIGNGKTESFNKQEDENASLLDARVARIMKLRNK